MTEINSNTVLVERLVTRRLQAPGVLNVRRLQRWRKRLYRSALLRDLVERLQERMALLAEAGAEALVWARGARELTADGSPVQPNFAMRSVSSAASAVSLVSGRGLASALSSAPAMTPASASKAVPAASPVVTAGSVPAPRMTSASTDKMFPFVARAHARLQSPGVSRVGELHSQRPTMAGVIDTKRLAMSLQARVDEASRGTGVTSGMSVTNSAVATNPLNAAFTQGVESSASGQQTPPRPIVERSTQVLVRESPAPIDRHASDATQVMALPTVSREITPTRRPTDPSRSPGTDDTQAASSTVATDVVVTETSPRSASLAMPTVFSGGRTPTRSPNSSHVKSAVDAEIEQRGESSVVSMARARAAQSAHNSLVLAAERVPVSNAPRPTLLLRKRAAAPVQPSQVQDATHHMSGERTRMPRTQTPSLQSKALPAQMAPPATPAQAPINIERIADEVGRLLERRLEMTARRRGRHAWS